MTVIAIMILMSGLVAVNLIYWPKTLIFKVIASIVFLIISSALYLLFVVVLWNSSNDPRELRLKEYTSEKVEVKQDVNWKGQYLFRH